MARGRADTARMGCGASSPRRPDRGNHAGARDSWRSAGADSFGGGFLDQHRAGRIVRSVASGVVDSFADCAKRKRWHAGRNHEFLQSALRDHCADCYGLYRGGDAIVFLGVCCGRSIPCRGYRGLCLSAGEYGADSRAGVTRSSVRRGVDLGCLRPGVEYLEIAIRPGRKLQVIARVRPGKICDESVSGVVGGAAFIREMELPEILETRRFLDGIPRSGCAAFFSTVVHDGHARSDTIQKKRAIAGERTVMRNDVNVNGAELVDGAHQQDFLVRSEVTQVKNAHLAKGEESA